MTDANRLTGVKLSMVHIFKMCGTLQNDCFQIQDLTCSHAESDCATQTEKAAEKQVDGAFGENVR